MKKLILSGGILTFLVAALALMSLTTPKAKVVHAPSKKLDSLLFTITNTSGVPVSFTFKDAGGFGPHGVTSGTTQFEIADETFEVILNCAGPPASFHMLFNTGENYYSPGHTFWGIVVSPTHTTSLDLY